MTRFHENLTVLRPGGASLTLFSSIICCRDKYPSFQAQDAEQGRYAETAEPGEAVMDLQMLRQPVIHARANQPADRIKRIRPNQAAPIGRLMLKGQCPVQRVLPRNADQKADDPGGRGAIPRQRIEPVNQFVCHPADACAEDCRQCQAHRLRQLLIIS